MNPPDRPENDATREAALLFHCGVGLLPILSVVLIWQLGLPVADGIFVAIVLGTLPLLSMAQLPLLHMGIADRLSAYAGSIVLLVGLGTVGLILGHLGPGLGALGLGRPTGEAMLVGLGGGLVAMLLLAGVFYLVEHQLGVEESPIVLALIPRTGREKRVFLVLSLAAGQGEELVFRGYLLAVLTPVFSGPWTAALVSSMAFAILHAYQGRVGIVRSGVLGFLFAALLIETGSLWPLVILHTGADVVAGFWLGPRIIAKQQESA